MNHLRQVAANLVAVVALLACVTGLEYTGAFDRLNSWLLGQRMAHAAQAASGDVVFLAIDKKSLDRMGIWPWPRGLYGEVIRRLVDLDARDIFFDIDFSATSDPEQDRLLAQALESAGGSVVLPAFLQRETASLADTRVSANVPIAMFRDRAWLASVNVTPSRDGLVHRFPYEMTIDGERVPSVPAMLSGISGTPGGSFAINYAVAADSVPVISVVDLLDGKIDRSRVEDKSVVVGAFALELRDTFAVPVHSVVSGSMLQILATETLLQDIVPAAVHPGPVLLATSLVIVGILCLGGPLRMRYRLAALAATAILLEASGYLLFADAAIVLPTVASHTAIATVAVVTIFRELNLSRWLLALARAETVNTNTLLERVVADSSDAILIVDEAGRIRAISRRAFDIFGIEADPAAADLADIVPDELVEATFRTMQEHRERDIRSGQSGDLVWPGRTGTRYIEYTVTPSRMANVRRHSFRRQRDASFACVTARDVTDRRQQHERLTYLSRHDELTGALRRHAFVEEIDDHLGPAEGDSRGCTLIALGLHRFKTVNATLGRGVGDLLLRAVAGRLAGCDPRFPYVARLGGDTFALFAPEALARAEVDDVCNRLEETIDRPFELGGTVARVGVRIGCYEHRSGGTVSGECLISNAELALDGAQKIAGSAIARYDPVASARQERARVLERELWNAIDRSEIQIVYQPQVDLKDGRMVGAEALARWTNPLLGAVPPDEFIEVAEANGFIERLGRWILETACQDAVRMGGGIEVAVNVSSVQLMRSDLVGDVRSVLQRTGLEPSRLCLEITESVFLESSETGIETFGELSAMGVSIALDDFGTGYSSFGFLSRFPLDQIKIDRMFAQSLATDATNRSVIKAIAALADGLDVTLLCEGIETPEQAAILNRMGCGLGQGYLFGKPMTASDIDALLVTPRRLIA